MNGSKTNAVEVAVAHVGTGVSLVGSMAHFNEFLHGAILLLTFAWWVRQIWKQRDSDKPPKFPGGEVGSVVAALLVAIGFAVTGCTTIRQTAETSGTGTNQVRRTTLVVRSLWDSHQVIESLRASNTDKAQSLGARGVEQDTSATNAVAVVEAVVGAAVRAAVKP